MLSLSNFEFLIFLNQEKTFHLRTETEWCSCRSVIGVSRGFRGTGSPSLDILNYLPTGFILIVHTQLPLTSILSFICVCCS